MPNDKGDSRKFTNNPNTINAILTIKYVFSGPVPISRWVEDLNLTLTTSQQVIAIKCQSLVQSLVKLPSWGKKTVHQQSKHLRYIIHQ